MAGHLQAQTTVATREDAERIAHTLVERRLAACVQILGPIRSTYRWKGKIENADEWLCLIKTRCGDYGAVEDALLELHPYETPEIIAVPIVAGSDDYLRWIEEETRKSRPADWFGPSAGSIDSRSRRGISRPSPRGP